MSIILVNKTVPHGIATKNTLFLFIHTIGHEFIFYKSFNATYVLSAS